MPIISTDTEKTYDGYDYTANYQTLIVKPNVFVLGDSGDGVLVGSQWYYGNLENYGNISGLVGVDVEDDNFKLSNFSGGIIQGTSFGIEAFNAEHLSIVNSGLISGDNGIDSHTGSLSVINDGSIESAVASLFMYGINNQISNFGSIKSDGDGIHLDQGCAATIQNDGLLQGLGSALYATDNSSSCKLVNNGIIEGDVRFGNATSSLRNTGTIDGDVSLGNGGSLFNGRGGAVSGTIMGGTGADKLIAGNDGETLAGGGGHDTMVGGAGEDTFAFASFQPADSDIIHQFNVTEDTVQLDHTVFTKLAADKTPVFAIGTAATSAADHLFYNSATGALSYDVDGSGTAGIARVIATLDTGLHLTASNFTVV